ncbi:12764_t:CDS:2, partial [Rhizophagus irregularis]
YVSASLMIGRWVWSEKEFGRKVSSYASYVSASLMIGRWVWSEKEFAVTQVMFPLGTKLLYSELNVQ